MRFIEWIKNWHTHTQNATSLICFRKGLFVVHVRLTYTFRIFFWKSNHSRTKKNSYSMNCFPICMSMIKSSTKAQLFYIRSDNGGLFFSLSSLNETHQYVEKLVPNIAFILNNSCKHIHSCIVTMTWIYVLFRIYEKDWFNREKSWNEHVNRILWTFQLIWKCSSRKWKHIRFYHRFSSIFPATAIIFRHMKILMIWPSLLDED